MQVTKFLVRLKKTDPPPCWNHLTSTHLVMQTTNQYLIKSTQKGYDLMCTSANLQTAVHVGHFVHAWKNQGKCGQMPQTESEKVQLSARSFCHIWLKLVFVSVIFVPISVVNWVLWVQNWIHLMHCKPHSIVSSIWTRRQKKTRRKHRMCTIWTHTERWFVQYLWRKRLSKFVSVEAVDDVRGSII